nr:phage portal protein [uncultured Allobaculum sp.]
MKLKNLFHRKVRDQTAGAGYRFFLGTSTSGKRVNERSSMQMTAVYSCVRILSEAIASLPLHVYEQSNNHSQKARDHPLYFLLHDEPNPEMTSFIFRETLMTHLLLWGNAYAQIIRNGKGEVVALYPLMPDRMKVDRDDYGQLYYEYQVSKADPKVNQTGTVRLQPHDVLHIPVLALMVLSDTHQLPWLRMPSGWPLPVRSMALSSLLMAQLLPEFSNTQEP